MNNATLTSTCLRQRDKTQRRKNKSNLRPNITIHHAKDFNTDSCTNSLRFYSYILRCPPPTLVTRSFEPLVFLTLPSLTLVTDPPLPTRLALATRPLAVLADSD